jgi:hypothetical protein
MRIDRPPSRRGFLTSLAAGCLTLLGVPAPRGGHRHHCTVDRQGGQHPDPRPDVDGSRVLTAEQLADAPEFIPLFDGIRAIPHVADGIRCKCGCAALEGFRSLLSCFEGGGMATMCDICQTEGRMAIRLHAQGRTLDQIRRAIDARF